ncbi:MAG: hypothetical protein JWP80_374 [Pseudomonas sp.]|nr:hypothetical protein [Pseudomonas sp.]
MKKATLVMATVVAFLLSGPVFAARVYPTMPPIKDVLGGTSTIVGDGIKVTGSVFSGEFIGAPVSKPLAVFEEATIASSAISGLAKGVITGGVGLAAYYAADYAFKELIDGVGWVMTDGAVSKPAQAGGTPIVYTPTGSQYEWEGPGISNAPSAYAGCPSTAGTPLLVLSHADPYFGSQTTFICTYRNINDSSEVSTGLVTRSGSSCPANSSYSVSQGGCLSAGTGPVPITAADLGVLDGFVKNKDGTWQRDLTTQLCGGLESCYQALSPTTTLNGPSTVSGTPQTVTTTSPTGTVSTTVKTPTTSITYGPNYYDTTTTTTTTNNNGGGTTTTTDDSTTTFPNIPDILGGANGGLGDINNGIPGTTSHTSPIPYMAWYSFSQSCTEITLVIPVYGAFQTALCPIYAKYIWPILYFFFAVFTWHTCFDIWRKTVLRVRAS